MILALETATEFGGVALLEGTDLIAERELEPGQHHARSLLAELDQLLKRAGRRLDEVDWIALSIGPGSFTGLRIGLASALGLCFGTARKIVPVPTLAALSLHAGAAPRIVPVLDARRNQIYTGLYAPGAVEMRADRVCDPRPWFVSLAGEGPLQLLGPGAQLYRELALEILSATACVLAPEQGQPRASSVGRLALRLAREGALCAPEAVELRYLRRAEAEANRALDTLPRNP